MDAGVGGRVGLMKDIGIYYNRKAERPVPDVYRSFLFPFRKGHEHGSDRRIVGILLAKLPSKFALLKNAPTNT